MWGQCELFPWFWENFLERQLQRRQNFPRCCLVPRAQLSPSGSGQTCCVTNAPSLSTSGGDADAAVPTFTLVAVSHPATSVVQRTPAFWSCSSIVASAARPQVRLSVLATSVCKAGPGRERHCLTPFHREMKSLVPWLPAGSGRARVGPEAAPLPVLRHWLGVGRAQVWMWGI